MLKWLNRPDWRTSKPHLELLSKFVSGSAPVYYVNEARWASVLQESPRKTIERFLEDGALVRADLAHHVSHVFRTPELKALLKARGLKVSGKREEQIARLVESDPDGMKQATKEAVVYICSEIGKKLSDDYVLAKDKQLADTEHDIKARLLRRDFEGASRAVARFEGSQVFPRGIGLDWQSHDTKYDVTVLTTIFDEVPEILAAIKPANYEILRLAAAHMHLWGTSKAKGYPDGFTTGIALDPDVAARMFCFHAIHRRELLNAKSRGVKQVRILGVGESPTRACPACEAIAGNIYSIDEVPTLPYPQCTCSLGCRCLMTTISPYGPQV